MIKREEQQILVEAPAILGIILMDHGEQHALIEVVRLKEAAESAIARADAAEARAVTWIPVAKRLPEPDLRVLAVYNDGRATTTIRALHLPALTATCWDGFEEAVYDEATDKIYYPGGWYEMVEEQEYAFYGPLPGKVTHWAQLPALPDSR